MTPDSQRIAIATACGWKIEVHATGRMRKVYDGKTVPDYLNDLNACAEMEKALTKEQCFLYNEILLGFFEDRDGPLTGANDWLWHATAPQRCEAFLRALSLWQPQPAS